MRTWVLILSIWILGIGCKKYYSCECTFIDPVPGTTVTSSYQMEKLSKKDAEDECGLTAASLSEFSGSCEIVKE